MNKTFIKVEAGQINNVKRAKENVLVWCLKESKGTCQVGLMEEGISKGRHHH